MGFRAAADVLGDRCTQPQPHGYQGAAEGTFRGESNNRRRMSLHSPKSARRAGQIAGTSLGRSLHHARASFADAGDVASGAVGPGDVDAAPLRLAGVARARVVVVAVREDP